MIRLERKKLLNELNRMSDIGHLLVIGEPGIGKSWILNELVVQRYEQKKITLLLKADELEISSMNDFKTALNINNELDTVLNSLSKGEHGALIVDALDAARSEPRQRAFRDLIHQVQTQCPDWSVVASIRIYDARRSRELLSLFPSGSMDTTEEFRCPDIRYRHLWVPLLTEEEIRDAIRQEPRLRPFYDKATPQLRQILRNPFYLWLANELIEEGVNVNQISSIQSEVQLLGLYWHERINKKPDAEDRRMLLVNAAKAMVDSHSLSVSRSDVYQQPGLTGAFNALLSEQVLKEVTVSGERLAFAHNMLFDYAVSRLLIPEEPKESLQFLIEEISRPIFLRPSITYYFARLWYDERDLFWKTFWHFMFDEKGEIGEHIRVLPALTIPAEVSDADDLQPLIDRLKEDKDLIKEGAKAVQRVLQCLQSLKGAPEPQKNLSWVEFFYRLREHLSIGFINEYVRLLNSMVDIWDQWKHPEQHKIAVTCRKTLEWTWGPPKGLNEAQIRNLTRMIGVWVVPLVCKTFGENSVESRKLLQNILERIRQPATPTQEIYRLTHEIAHLWPYDPDFVADIYKAVFEYEETSAEKTILSSGVVGLTSTRRQDYQMCYYILEEEFPKFLKTHPMPATRAMVWAVNAATKREHVFRYSSAVPKDLEPSPFPFNDKTARYLPDPSYVWDQGDLIDHYYYKKMLSHLDIFLEDLARSNNGKAKELLTNILNEIVKENEVAVIWRHILKLAIKHPSFFIQDIYPLLTAEPILVWPETNYEVGELLKVGFEYLEAEQRRQIEKSLLFLPNATQAPMNQKGLERLYLTLISCIPEGLLTCEESRRILSAHRESGEGIPENRSHSPIFEFSSKKSTESDWLMEEGADLTTPANKKLIEFSNPAREFEDQHLNKIPSIEACEQILPQLLELHNYLEGTAEVVDEPVRESALKHLAGACETIARTHDLPYDHEALKLAQKVFYLAGQDRSPEFNPKYHATFDSPSWSPAPRIEAAQGIMHLVSREEFATEENLNLVEKLSQDQVPAVRFHIVINILKLYYTAPEKLWEIALRIAEREPTNGVLTGLAEALRDAASVQPERVLDVLEIICKRQPSAKRKGISLVDPCLSAIAGLFIAQDNSRANKILKQYESDPIKGASELVYAVLTASNYLLCGIAKSWKEDPDSVRKRAREVMSRALSSSEKGFLELQEKFGDSWPEERQKAAKELYEIVDQVATRLYFTADVRTDSSKQNKIPLDDRQRAQYYHEIRPLIKQVIKIGFSPGGFLPARTAHYLMQLLNGVLPYGPSGVIALADELCKASAAYGYTLDSLAIQEVVKLVETCLADYKEILQHEQDVAHLVSLLNIFVEAGWPEAIQLVFRLEEIFR